MSSYHRLDNVHMSAIDREHAKAHMRSAELIIDFVFAAMEKFRQFTTGNAPPDCIGHLASQLASPGSTVVAEYGIPASVKASPRSTPADFFGDHSASR